MQKTHLKKFKKLTTIDTNKLTSTFVNDLKCTFLIISWLTLIIISPTNISAVLGSPHNIFCFYPEIFLFNFTLVMFRKLFTISLFDEFSIRIDNLTIVKRHDSLFAASSAIWRIETNCNMNVMLLIHSGTRGVLS